ncbi:Methyl-accepting chemotaxis protein signailing domain-containing protein [Desulfonema limicola]|uniref:Methyl-accepting chemotaxis protein signailing domain-containing protein n=1 Tax=Desulfonema limicola TaxID=45656 RepID=A0A975B9F5_9BACT|nr:methyl-accepting chemotaxis protein [Desulfonema limicola]QTA81188.1 Methyl-accepting chemotaxis protein signailing domain-containing protein [Desulfonema limicola]
MIWKKQTISAKINTGFEMVLIFLTISTILSYSGINHIVKHAHEVIKGNELDGNLAQKEVDHLNWAQELNTMLINNDLSQMKIETSPHECEFGKWLYSDKRNNIQNLISSLKPILENIESPHAKLHESSANIIQLYKNDLHPDIQKKAFEIYKNETQPNLKEMQNLLDQIRNQARQNIMTDEQILIASRQTRFNVAVIGIIAIISGVVLAFLIIRNISKILREITGELTTGAGQISAVSNEIASSSQELARRASDQADALKETAVNVNNIAVSGKNMAKLTLGAKQRMNENIDKSARSLTALIELTQNINQIEQDSEKIKNIIKVIDEISFQTNLLALNAAVEAARAGEAGSGFAVVAGEVRNLAVRSAKAAQDTQYLLEETTTSIKSGASALRQVNDDFKDIVKSAAILGEKTASITNASVKQSNQLENIKDSTTQLETITQQNAAAAEQFSAAVEELSSQASVSLEIVNRLALLTGDKK